MDFCVFSERITRRASPAYGPSFGACACLKAASGSLYSGAVTQPARRTAASATPAPFRKPMPPTPWNL